MTTLPAASSARAVTVESKFAATKVEYNRLDPSGLSCETNPASLILGNDGVSALAVVAKSVE